MATFTVRQGKRYRATISLGMIERMATNDMIADKMRSAGFSEVAVSGSGALRVVEAVWSQPDTTSEMPSQVSEVVEV